LLALHIGESIFEVKGMRTISNKISKKRGECCKNKENSKNPDQNWLNIHHFMAFLINNCDVQSSLYDNFLFEFIVFKLSMNKTFANFF